jgi:hypothetical protein
MCKRFLVLVQAVQIRFHRSVIDAQELVGGGHHVDPEGFTLGTFLVLELLDRFFNGRVLQIDAHDKKDCSAQR